MGRGGVRFYAPPPLLSSNDNGLKVDIRRWLKYIYIKPEYKAIISIYYKH